MLEVVATGPLLTLQDRGRPGLAHLGVPPSGACDPWGLAVANALVEAPTHATAVEVTLTGAELLVVERCVVALAGADLGAERDDGRPLAPDAVHALPAGARIRFSGPAGGMRGYLALAGGIAVAQVLGSAATCPAAHLGGIDGRPLAPGDRLVPVSRDEGAAAGRRWPSVLAPHPAARRGPLAVVAGPDLRHLPDDTLERLAGSSWRAAPASDRMGIRLDGAALAAGREILSHPIVPGVIQVPGDGQPIVLLTDGPTIGGYPVAAVVPTFELPRLGQIRPGDPVAFAVLDAGTARSARRAQDERFEAAVAALRADVVWERLADDAIG